MGHRPGLRGCRDGDKVRLPGGQMDPDGESWGVGGLGEEHLLDPHHIFACWLVQHFHGTGETSIGRQREN